MIAEGGLGIGFGVGGFDASFFQGRKWNGLVWSILDVTNRYEKHKRGNLAQRHGGTEEAEVGRRVVRRQVVRGGEGAVYWRRV